MFFFEMTAVLAAYILGVVCTVGVAFLADCVEGAATFCDFFINNVLFHLFPPFRSVLKQTLQYMVFMHSHSMNVAGVKYADRRKGIIFILVDRDLYESI